MAEGTESLEYNNGPTKWNLIQYTLLCCYTAGLHGSISLPFYVSVYSPVFLIAYYVLMIVVCIPVCYVQIKLGAVYRRGIVGVFTHLVPLFKGVAVAILALTFIRCLTNGLELSYSLFYAFVSFAKPYPVDLFETGLRKKIHSPSYFGDDFLQRSDNIDESGNLVWYIVICLIVTWTVIFLLTFRGTPFLGKLSYVVSPLALVLTTVVFIYGYSVDMPHSPSVPEFKHYKISQGDDNTTVIEDDVKAKVMTFGMDTLISPKPWIDALTLHLHAIGLWSGILPMLGSQMYNKKIIINASWAILLIIYGLLPLAVVFALFPYYDQNSHVGFLASSNGVKPGLSFILIGLFGKARYAPIIAMCLYLAIFLFGILHQALHFLTIMDAVLPSIPKLFMKFLQKRDVVLAVACVFSFFLSLPYTSQGGIYLYTIVNSYVDRLIFTVIIISMVPFLIGYIKQEYLYLPIERVCMSIWYGLASVFPAALLIYYFSVYVYPIWIVGYDSRWAETFGWVIAVAPITISVILGAVHAVMTQKGSLKQKFIQAIKTEHLRTTDSTTDYDFSDTANTGMMTSKSPSSNGVHTGSPRIDTEVVIPPPHQGQVVQV